MTSAEFRARILLVDDQPSNLLVLQAILGDLGQELVTARSGREALRRLLDDDYALILMDVQMPGMDGLETAALIRERERTRLTPIIFLTAHEVSDVQTFRGYSVGAVDYLIKPLTPDVLRAKVSVFVDLFRKTEEVRRQSEQLREAERREHERRLADERLRQEFRFAGEVQKRLYPAAPPAHPVLDVFGASFPAEITGGDYFDYIPRAGGRLAVAIGDVCGHGIGPALLMAATRAYLRALMLGNAPLDQTVSLVNQALAADMAEDLFVTLLVGEFDTSGHTFHYTSAGHQPGWVVDASGAIKAVLDSTAPPLAIMPEGDFPEAPPVQLESGDVMLLVTDGVVEAAVDATPFGAQRALNVLRDHRDGRSAEIVHALYHAVREFARPGPVPDDVTALVIKVNA